MGRPTASSAPENKPLLTVDQVCERTQFSPSTIRRALKAGDLDFIRIRRAIRVSEADLTRFLNRHHSNRGK
jgi:excisionase family DNA binding protein